MNIGFDLDGVFINTPPFIPRWVIDKFYKEKDNGELIYRIPGHFEKYIRRASHVPLLRPQIQENVNFLKDLSKNKDYTLFLISSRFDFLAKATKRISEKYDFATIFKQTVFNIQNLQPHLFKEAMIEKLKIERFVDDDLSLLKYLAKNNTKTKFYWFNNSLEKKLGENIFAIKNIDDVLK